MKSLIIKLNNYTEELEEISTELQTLPAGRLAKRGAFYYHVTNEKAIGITRNKGLIRALCRKKYLLIRKKQIDSNISIIPRDMSKFDEATPSEIIRALPPTYKELPIEYFYHPSIEDFLAKDYTKNPYKPEERKYPSKNGTMFRSKSEVFIANQLEDYKIPYHYDVNHDVKLRLNNRLIYPDFIIKSPFNGQIFIWEHFGMVHKDEYEQSMNGKMALYMKRGYTPFETIIYTFEADIEVEDNQRLKHLIEDIVMKS